MCDEGRRALAAGSPERAAGRLRAALAEWRGPPLAEVSFEPFAQAEVVTPGGLHAAALEDRIEADLLAGRHGELVAELEALVARHPLRERLRGQLMLALYRAGRQGDALDAYRQAVADARRGARPASVARARAARAGDPGPRSGAAARAARRRQPPGAERRRATATILFTDLAGSTRMRGELGDEDADAVRREHDRRLRDVIAAHGGQEVKALGDGFLAAFEPPVPRSPAPVDMQRAIDRQAHRGPVPLALRVGIGAGDVAWEADDVFGTPVVEAQRLCAAAAQGRSLSPTPCACSPGSRSGRARGRGRAVAARSRAPGARLAVRWTASAPSPSRSPPRSRRRRRRRVRRARGAARRAARGLDDASAGRRRGVFVTGEPGIGKTRLAAELAASRASGRAASCCTGAATTGLPRAAQPFAAGAAAYVAAVPARRAARPARRRGPAIWCRCSRADCARAGHRRAAPAAPEVERLRTLEATAALLEAAGAAAPVLLVLDDLHWADELSLLLLHHVLRADVPMRVLVVATYRDTEPSRSPLLADVVTGLARRPDVSRLELAPLAEPDVAAILTHAGRPPSLAARVRAMTEGNPFFVGEVVRALGEERDAGAAVTPRVRDVVRWRLARLPAGTAEVLTAAAVAGAGVRRRHRCRRDRHRRSSARSTRWRPPSRRGSCVPPGALDRFTFAHALVRETIVGELPAGRRVRLHARIAQRARTRGVHARRRRQRPGRALRTPPATLVDARRPFATRARPGDEAAAGSRSTSPPSTTSAPLRAHERLPSAPRDERLDLELARGRALRARGRRARRPPLLRGVAAAAEAAGDGARMAEALLTSASSYADLLEEDAEMVALLRRALALLPPGDSAIRARLEGFLAQEAFSSVPDHERREMVDRAPRHGAPCRRSDGARRRAHRALLDRRGPESVAERLALADELVAVGREARLPYAECDGQQFRLLALIELGEIEAVDAALAAAHAAVRTLKSRWTVGYLDTRAGAAGGSLRRRRRRRRARPRGGARIVSPGGAGRVGVRQARVVHPPASRGA